jgi:hypothetical protein
MRGDMDRMRRNLDLATNVAILLVCILIGYVALTRYILPGPTTERIDGPQIGTRLNIQGLPWEASNQYLVLALSTQCHFCSESAPFYQKLSAAAEAKGVPIIAVLPQPIEQSKQYLETIGVQTQHQLQMQLSKINVVGTPTIVLTDRQGIAKNIWVGKLSGEQEADVLKRIE